MSEQAYRGPAKFTPEEQARGNVGIRWVTAQGVAGRPTLHDVREYLAERGEEAACTCDECQAWMLSNEQVSALRASHAELVKALTNAAHELEIRCAFGAADVARSALAAATKELM